MIVLLALGAATVSFAWTGSQDGQESPASEPASEADSSETGTQAIGGPARSGRYLRLLGESNEVLTTSTTFQDIPGLVASISIVGTAPACVAATFSGEVTRGGFSDSGEVLRFRALVDGSLMEGHNVFGNLFHKPSSTVYELVSYTFWKCGLTPGAHTVAIQWGSTAGSIVAIRGRTLIIEGP